VRFEQFLVKLLLAGQRPFPGAQDLALEFLEVRGDVPFGSLERLAANIIFRRFGRLRLADLDVITVDPVEADF